MYCQHRKRVLFIWFLFLAVELSSCFMESNDVLIIQTPAAVSDRNRNQLLISHGKKNERSLRIKRELQVQHSRNGKDRCHTEEGSFIADVESDCHEFSVCSFGVIHKFYCPEGTLFNQRYLICDWSNNVRCSDSFKFITSSHVQLDRQEPQKLFDFNHGRELLNASRQYKTLHLSPSAHEEDPNVNPKLELSTTLDVFEPALPSFENSYKKSTTANDGFRLIPVTDFDPSSSITSELLYPLGFFGRNDRSNQQYQQAISRSVDHQNPLKPIPKREITTGGFQRSMKPEGYHFNTQLNHNHQPQGINKTKVAVSYQKISMGNIYSDGHKNESKDDLKIPSSGFTPISVPRYQFTPKPTVQLNTNQRQRSFREIPEDKRLTITKYSPPKSGFFQLEQNKFDSLNQPLTQKVIPQRDFQANTFVRDVSKLPLKKVTKPKEVSLQYELPYKLSAPIYSHDRNFKTYQPRSKKIPVPLHDLSRRPLAEQTIYLETNKPKIPLTSHHDSLSSSISSSPQLIFKGTNSRNNEQEREEPYRIQEHRSSLIGTAQNKMFSENRKKPTPNEHEQRTNGERNTWLSSNQGDTRFEQHPTVQRKKEEFRTENNFYKSNTEPKSFENDGDWSLKVPNVDRPKTFEKTSSIKENGSLDDTVITVGDKPSSSAFPKRISHPFMAHRTQFVDPRVRKTPKFPELPTPALLPQKGSSISYSKYDKSLRDSSHRTVRDNDQTNIKQSPRRNSRKVVSYQLSKETTNSFSNSDNKSLNKQMLEKQEVAQKISDNRRESITYVSEYEQLKKAKINRLRGDSNSSHYRHVTERNTSNKLIHNVKPSSTFVGTTEAHPKISSPSTSPVPKLQLSSDSRRKFEEERITPNRHRRRQRRINNGNKQNLHRRNKTFSRLLLRKKLVKTPASSVLLSPQHANEVGISDEQSMSETHENFGEKLNPNFQINGESSTKKSPKNETLNLILNNLLLSFSDNKNQTSHQKENNKIQSKKSNLKSNQKLLKSIANNRTLEQNKESKTKMIIKNNLENRSADDKNINSDVQPKMEVKDIKIIYEMKNGKQMKKIRRIIKKRILKNE